jgi:hypothetical protein
LAELRPGVEPAGGGADGGEGLEARGQRLGGFFAFLGGFRVVGQEQPGF